MTDKQNSPTSQPKPFEAFPQPQPRIQAMMITSQNRKELQEFCTNAVFVPGDENARQTTEVAVKNRKGYICSGNVLDWLIQDADGYFNIMTFAEFWCTFRPIQE